MKKLKKSLIVIFLILTTLVAVTSNYVWAINSEGEFNAVDYTNEFKQWIELSDEEKEKTIQPRAYNVYSANNISKSPFYLARLLGASNSSTYSLKNVIPDNVKIRNQGLTNTCWAFAALSSLETNLALSDYKNGVTSIKEYDFSERHMEYATSKVFANDVENAKGYNRTVGSGGQWYMAESYLTNGSGAISEGQMPFEDNENIIDISQLNNKTIISQVYDTVDFANYASLTGAERAEVITQIKQHIQNYGSVFAPVHGNSSSSVGFSCYNNETGAKYCNNATTHVADHAVSIIGWDDNYAITNFAEGARPSSPGAWIIRNSWGESREYDLLELKRLIFNKYQSDCERLGWTEASLIPNSFIEQSGYTINGDKAVMKIGDNGLMYVSYEDCNISKLLYGIVKAKDSVDYDNIYQYDEFYPIKAISFTSSNIMLCNIFDKKTSGKEYITQVSLYAPETYTCRVYVNPNGTGKGKDDLQLVNLKDGESETINPGYHTLEFASPIKINANSFAVAIEVTGTRNSGINFLIETNKSSIPTFASVTVQQGKCFVGSSHDLDSCTWFDIGQLEEIKSTLYNGDSTVKAFTISSNTEDSLKNIEIVTPPNKTSYKEGENFDSTGMVIKANYNDGTSKILDSSEYTIENGTNMQDGQTAVTIKYEGKSVNQTITVEKNEIEELKIKNPPTKTSYYEGENFDKTGMVVEVKYKDGTTKEITNYDIENGTNINKEQSYVTIKYMDKSVNQPITVKVKEKAKNSNLDNAKCTPTKMKVYIDTNNSNKNYVLIDTTISNIARETSNDSVEYYYYISTNKNEQNINNWVKIKTSQTSNDKIQFTIDSRELSNYIQITEKDEVYLYIKEVAKKGESQSTVISDAIKLEADDNMEIETFVDGNKKNNNNNNNNNNLIDNTVAPGKIPQTGVGITAIVLVSIISIISVCAYIKYKKMDKEIK